jgi:SSS family transporter
MQLPDWIVLGIYFVGVLVLGAWLARRQKSTDDYFLGGKRMPGGLVGVSLAANQVSAISLVSAPAFVALRPDGGLRWLQYELAVPLAMVGVIVLLGPLYPRLSSASLYEFAERRFGPGVRTALSSIFLISRGLATGITLYTTALVLSVGMGFPLLNVYLLLGLFAVAYTTLGGIQADIYSDVIQFAVLWVGVVVAMIVAAAMLTDLPGSIGQLEAGRLAAIDLRHNGLGDGHTFSFWPMLIGGLFLYMSYYGCDQSQAQRLMATGDLRAVRKSLVINGMIRFPVVLTYCLFGLLLAVLLAQDASFASQLSGKKPDYLVPAFLVTYLPVGIRGLVISGIFAAAMSSIDSALNSLSAITVEDFVSKSRWARLTVEPRRRLLVSRGITLLWGVFCLASGLVLARSSKTIIELVNMVGSAFYGPILAVFVCGLLIRRVRGQGMLLGLLGGVAGNLLLWKAAPNVSWLWWNPAGFLVAVVLASGASLVWKGAPGDLSDTKSPAAPGPGEKGEGASWLLPLRKSFRESRGALLVLTLYFFLILGLTAAMGFLLSGQ